MASNYTWSEQGPETAEIVWTTIYFFESTVVFVSNGLTVVTFTINRHLLRRSVYCLVNLAVADMVVGLGTFISNIVILMVFGINALVDKQFLYHKNTSVTIQSTVYYFTINATMLSLIVVALERLLATLWPLRHRTLKSSAYVIFIVFPWILALMISIGSSFNGEGDRNYLGGPWMVLITLILCFTYIAIYVKFKCRNMSQQFYAQRLLQREKRLVTTVFLVTFASIFTWTPMALVLLIRDIDAFPVPYQAHMGAVAILVMNSFVNPVIYAFRMKDFKRALGTLMCRCIQRVDQIEPAFPGNRFSRYITESV